MTDEEKIKEHKNRLAIRKARLDQRKKQFEAQYPFMHPIANLARWDDIQATEFIIELHEWELEGFIKNQEEEDLESE